MHTVHPIALRWGETAPRPTALVADTDSDTRALIAYTLERGGWSVRQARDAAQAQQLTDTHMPRVIVLDSAMVRTSGVRLLDAVEDWRERRIPVIVVSTLANCRDRPVLHLADAIVQKPFRPSHLVARVNQHTKARRKP